MITSALLGYYRVPGGRRMGVVTASGGACDIIADRSSELGIEIPTSRRRRPPRSAPHLPPFAAARNPLDVTGYVLANAATSYLNALDYALEATLTDPGLDFVLYGGVNLPDAEPPAEMAAAQDLAAGVDQREAHVVPHPGHPDQPDHRGCRLLRPRGAQPP